MTRQRDGQAGGENGTYRILAMDGGPSVQTYVRYLEVIVKQRPDFLSKIDMLAGSSDGAFAALWLATRPNIKEAFSPKNALDTVRGLKEFMIRVFETAKPGLLGYVRLASGFGVLERLDRTIELMTREYGEGRTLGDLDIDVCLPAYCIAHRSGERPIVEPYPMPDQFSGADILCNFGVNDHSGVNAVNAALMSGSFPILFPVQMAHADGGVGAQNPSMAALAQVIANTGYPGVPPPKIRPTPRIALDKTMILSFGSDQQVYPERIRRAVLSRDRAELGYLWWTVNLAYPLMVLGVLADGLNTSVSAQMRTILSSRYLRVAPPPRGGHVRQLLYYALRMNERVFRNAEEAADHWGNDPGSHQLHPNLRDTLNWIDALWVPPPEVRPAQETAV